MNVPPKNDMIINAPDSLEQRLQDFIESLPGTMKNKWQEILTSLTVKAITQDPRKALESIGMAAFISIGSYTAINTAPGIALQNMIPISTLVSPGEIEAQEVTPEVVRSNNIWKTLNIKSKFVDRQSSNALGKITLSEQYIKNLKPYQVQAMIDKQLKHINTLLVRQETLQAQLSTLEAKAIRLAKEHPKSINLQFFNLTKSNILIRMSNTVEKARHYQQVGRGIMEFRNGGRLGGGNGGCNNITGSASEVALCALTLELNNM